jgi:hypothetical protein
MRKLYHGGGNALQKKIAAGDFARSAALRAGLRREEGEFQEPFSRP